MVGGSETPGVTLRAGPGRRCPLLPEPQGRRPASSAASSTVDPGSLGCPCCSFLSRHTSALVTLRCRPLTRLHPTQTAGHPNSQPCPDPAQWGRRRDGGTGTTPCSLQTGDGRRGRPGARSPLLSPPHAPGAPGRVQDTGPLPGSGAVQASHWKSSLGSEGCPTPATLLAAILNSYDEPSVKPSTCSGRVYMNTQHVGHVTVRWGRGVQVTE